MDKDQKPVTEALIRDTMGFVIYRSVANLILSYLNKYKEITKNKTLSLDEFWLNIRRGDYKKEALAFIDRLTQTQEDVASEVMTQYGMKSFSDATQYHDILIKIVREGIDVAKQAIEDNRYEFLIRMSQMTQYDALWRF